CDGDTILMQIEQVGDVACHTGARSCFFTAVPTSIFDGHGAIAPDAP
ncbi:MAG: bifunctional phosphoribosyl-AMP cyclohydrolase/phosphoribosyl-ATP diphosphatase, partial [Oscillatoriales cyanobacterium]